MWFILALLSSVFAAAASILAKAGIEDVNSSLAAAVRTAVVFVMARGMVFMTGARHGIGGNGKKNLIFVQFFLKKL